jgi:hypothetical protein
VKQALACPAGPYWAEAASCVSVKGKQPKQLGGGRGSQIALNLSDSQQFIQRPPTSEELQVGRG